jgi:hypothetical protein
MSETGPSRLAIAATTAIKWDLTIPWCRRRERSYCLPAGQTDDEDDELAGQFSYSAENDQTPYHRRVWSGVSVAKSDDRFDWRESLRLGSRRRWF